MRRNLFSLVLAATAAFSMIPMSVVAQEHKTPTKTPTLSDGHPDLTGIWIPAGPKPAGSGFGKQYADGSKLFAAFTAPADPEAVDPTGASVFDSKGRIERYKKELATAPNQAPYKPELKEKVSYLDDNANFNDPVFRCGVEGLPRIGPPLHIYSIPGRVLFVYGGQAEYFNIIREIATDGRPHDTANQDTNYGDSVGHWEGNTLVVDSINFNDKTWLNDYGTFHSDKMHVIERFTRVGDALKYEVTVEDPVVFTRPWVMNPRSLKTADKDESGFDALEEAAQCDERDQGHIVDGHL